MHQSTEHGSVAAGEFFLEVEGETNRHFLLFSSPKQTSIKRDENESSSIRVTEPKTPLSRNAKFESHNANHDKQPTVPAFLFNSFCLPLSSDFDAN